MATVLAQKWEEDIDNDNMWYCYVCGWSGDEDNLTLCGARSRSWYICPTCNSPQVDYIPPDKEIKKSLERV
jgi:hypothetical protein